MPESKRVEGTNTIQYVVLEPGKRLQLDLQPPMQLVSAEQNGKSLKIEHLEKMHYILLENEQAVGSTQSLKVQFKGTPRVAVNPPWDGGFVWSKHKGGQPFIANANQGIGSSIWWPCKDHPYDEADSLKLSITVPKNLTAVGNGRLIDTKTDKNSKTYVWQVKNPINNYAVNTNIANYTHFSETYNGEKGKLSLDYYVLPENKKKAMEQFKQVPKMMEAFEHWFGPYPFYEDGYKLVEVPYLGMEHQSSVTYGNGYKNGYKATDWSKTGWGLKWDFIIIHESGHEWFANNITNKDVADMWIHESFTAYSESLYLDYHFGTEAANAYVQGIRMAIQNDSPIIGLYNLDNSGSSDMYFKGSNMLHTLRQWINDDAKWREILRGLNQEFYHQTVTTQQIEGFIAEKSGLELEPFFNQYLRTTMVPTLEYRFMEGKLFYRWQNVVEGFAMPIKVTLNGKEIWLTPSTVWNAEKTDSKDTRLQVDKNFYVGEMNNTVIEK